MASPFDQFQSPAPVDVAGTPFQDQPSALSKLLFNQPAMDVRDPQRMAPARYIVAGGKTLDPAQDAAWDDATTSPNAKRVREIMGSKPMQRLMDLANFLGPGPKMPRPVMAPPDPTRTGWTFRDVARPHNMMEKGDWRMYEAMRKGGEWLDVELPIRSMYATQEKVNPDFMSPVGKNVDPPVVMKKGGKYFVQDGHHRLTKAAQEGKQTAPVRLIDIDGTTQTEFPLLEWLQRKPD